MVETVTSGKMSTNQGQSVNDVQGKVNIVGLDELERQLMNTFPNVHNKPQWEQIRNTIISCSEYDDEIRFLVLVKRLACRRPNTQYLELQSDGSLKVVRMCNQVEWNEIRNTCCDILSDWDSSSDKQQLFNKLLKFLSRIFPEQDNKEEWAAIRDVCNNILNNFTTKN